MITINVKGTTPAPSIPTSMASTSGKETQGKDTV